ncbi:pheromone processing endoprotease [Ascosphaera atra]|nr:pheromone processing endoprotease [Ascosphaera atra]
MDTGDWQQTAVGKPFSHMYGYGKVDAYSLVKKAKDWTSVKPQAWFDSPWLSVHHEVPQGEVGLASYFEVTDTMLKRSNVERLEHVTVTMNVEHTRRGDLSVELRSPSGVVSHLSTPRSKDTEEAGYVDWTFMSVAHWGESGIGKWTIIVKDTKVNEHKGKFIDWQLTLWGEAIDAVHQRLRPLPSEHEHDHDQSEPAPHVTTTSVQPHPTGAVSSELPSDHPHRPTKPKPITSTASASTTGSSTATAGATISPSALPDSENNDKNVLPSFFPTFGVSKRTQIWIYIALGLIILFCSGLGAYFCIQRRKRLRNDVRDDYEFEMLNEDDEEGYPLAGGRSGAKKSKRTGGELYDAFAGESDEELLSEDDDDDDHDGHHDAQTSTYRDQPLEDQRPHNDHPEGDEGEGRETGQARD